MRPTGTRRRVRVIARVVTGRLAVTTTAEVAPVVINSMRRKLWGILLLLQVIWMPAVHAATYSGGSGTEGDPYLISIPQDLVTLANTANSADWSRSFLMTQDIEMSGVTGFTPIGNSTTAFTGVFDGGGHVIRNLYIDRPDTDYVGLFGHITSGGSVDSLGIEDGAVTGNDYVGGLVGYNSSTYVTVRGCYATSPVTGNNGMVGGLVGWNYGTVTSCYATGAVTGAAYVGGLVGHNTRTVTSCYATGTVTGNSYVGGLVGINNSDATVTGCYATGAVTGGTILGGLVGASTFGPVTASFWDIDVGGPDNGFGTGLPTAQMKQRATFESAGWDFTGSPPVWYIFEGQSYPYLFGMPSGTEGEGEGEGEGEEVQVPAAGLAATAILGFLLVASFMAQNSRSTKIKRQQCLP